MKSRFLVSCLCLLRLSTPGADSIVVVYNDPAYDTDNVAPFGISNPFTMRYQQVYGASLFSPINPGGGWITTIAVAFDPPNGSLVGFITELQIDLSTTPRSPDALSTTFSENVGPDDMVVIGPYTEGFAQTGIGTGLPVPLPLDHPFYYNPAQGNLLMDVRVIQQNEPPIGFFDATSRLGDPVSRVYAVGVNSLTGTADTLGLDTAFVITPVPEPAALGLFVLGLSAAFLVFRQCRRR